MKQYDLFRDGFGIRCRVHEQNVPGYNLARRVDIEPLDDPTVGAMGGPRWEKALALAVDLLADVSGDEEVTARFAMRYARRLHGVMDVEVFILRQEDIERFVVRAWFDMMTDLLKGGA